MRPQHSDEHEPQEARPHRRAGALLPVFLVVAIVALAVSLSAGVLTTFQATPIAVALAATFLVVDRWTLPTETRPGTTTGLAQVVDRELVNGEVRRPIAAIVVELRGIAADTIVDGAAAWSEPIAVVARRMASADLGEGFSLARLGPHTFGAVVFVDDRVAAVAAAESLVALCRVPVPTPVRAVRIDAVAGVSHAEIGERTTGEQLIRAADASLRVDGNVAAPVAASDHRLLRHARRVIEVETEIRHSLDVDLLTAKLLPVLDVRDDAIVGFRSAYDWTSVSTTDPDQLGSIASALGLRRSIETQYLMRSINAAETLPLDGHRCVVARIDSTRLTDPRVVSQISLLLQASGLAPEHLVLEFGSWGGAVIETGAVDELQNLGVGLGLTLHHHGNWGRVPEALIGRLDRISVRAGDLLDADGLALSHGRVDSLRSVADGDLGRLTVTDVDNAGMALELSAAGLSTQCGAVHGRAMAAADLRAWMLNRTAG